MTVDIDGEEYEVQVEADEDCFQFTMLNVNTGHVAKQETFLTEQDGWDGVDAWVEELKGNN